MTTALQLGNRTISSVDLIPLLTRYKLIPQLLCESIIDRAISPILCTPDETAQACQEFYQQWGLTSEAEQQEWRSHYGLTPDQLEQLATHNLRLAKFKQATWGHRLESSFLKRARQLDQVIYSLIRSKDRAIVNELYFRILEGEQSFAALAQQYSQGAEAQTGGVLGPFELGTLTPNLAQLLDTLPVGEVHSPVRFGEWYIIVRVEQKIPARFDHAMRQRLLKENFEAWFQEQLSQLSHQEQVWMGVASHQ